MGQNRSPAVMQQRIEAPDSLDDFPTPSWGTRALFEHIVKPRQLVLGTAAEPACNRGYMARPLREYFGAVRASDVFDYSAECAEPHEVNDFLLPGWENGHPPVNWIVSNPPFRLAEQFIAQARVLAMVGCAMLVRTSFLEGGQRYRNLFSVTPPTIIAQFAERIILTKGIVRDPAKLYWDPEALAGQGAWKRPSTATSYCWMIWLRDRAPEPFAWIPPCRLQLERAGDYPAVVGAAPFPVEE